MNYFHHKIVFYICYENGHCHHTRLVERVLRSYCLCSANIVHNAGGPKKQSYIVIHHGAMMVAKQLYFIRLNNSLMIVSSTYFGTFIPRPYSLWSRQLDRI